jgi:hypothetical protein
MAVLDVCEKSRPHQDGFDPRTVQPIASRYTDWATQPTTYIHSLHKYDMLMEFITGIGSVHHSLAGTIPHD